MAQIFPKSANAIARMSVYGAIFVLVFVGWAFDALNRSAYNTRAFMAREQPIPFSHAHHVGGLGLDCRYCHTSVESSSFANVPRAKAMLVLPWRASSRFRSATHITSAGWAWTAGTAILRSKAPVSPTCRRPK